MPNILILGATGSLAREVIATAARNPALHLTLFARNPRNLPAQYPAISGDALDPAALQAAMAGQDIVYVNLAGDLARMGANIVAALSLSAPSAFTPRRCRTSSAPTAPSPMALNNPGWITPSSAPTGLRMPTKLTTNSRRKINPNAAAPFRAKALPILSVNCSPIRRNISAPISISANLKRKLHEPARNPRPL